ncbi:MAG TPA: GntR family transcriptional regulator [Desulfobacterales bacterium]|nr:GntR family transcriptional regulator [Desulfobacterales bacterium]
MLTIKIKKLNIKPSVIAQQVSQVLLDAILVNDLKGGEQLLEAPLQKQFEISRSPLREAFRDLEKKGVVEIIPRKGAFVKRVTRRDIEENYSVRTLLEGLAAKEAYHKMTGKDHEALQKTISKMKKAVINNNIMAYWKHHSVFHDIFITASGNRVLIKILGTLRIHSVQHRFSFPNYDEKLQNSLDYHKKILDLFISQNTDDIELENLVKEHIEIALKTFITNVREP